MLRYLGQNKKCSSIDWYSLHLGFKFSSSLMMNQPQGIAVEWTGSLLDSWETEGPWKRRAGMEGTRYSLGSIGTTLSQVMMGLHSEYRTYLIMIQKRMAYNVFADICWWCQAMQPVEQFHTGNMMFPGLFVQLIPEHTGYSLEYSNNNK